MDCFLDESDKDGKGAFMYYVNDGVYGSFNSLLYDHAEVAARLVNVSCLVFYMFVPFLWDPDVFHPLYFCGKSEEMYMFSCFLPLLHILECAHVPLVNRKKIHFDLLFYFMDCTL